MLHIRLFVSNISTQSNLIVLSPCQPDDQYGKLHTVIRTSQSNTFNALHLYKTQLDVLASYDEI